MDVGHRRRGERGAVAQRSDERQEHRRGARGAVRVVLGPQPHERGAQEERAEEPVERRRRRRARAAAQRVELGVEVQIAKGLGVALRRRVARARPAGRRGRTASAWPSRIVAASRGTKRTRSRCVGSSHATTPSPAVIAAAAHSAARNVSHASAGAALITVARAFESASATAATGDASSTTNVSPSADASSAAPTTALSSGSDADSHWVAVQRMSVGRCG